MSSVADIAPLLAYLKVQGDLLPSAPPGWTGADITRRTKDEVHECIRWRMWPRRTRVTGGWTCARGTRMRLDGRLSGPSMRQHGGQNDRGGIRPVVLVAAMTRLPASAAVLLLADSGIHVTPATLRQWRARGHLSKGAGYDPVELLELMERRGKVAA